MAKIPNEIWEQLKDDYYLHGYSQKELSIKYSIGLRTIERHASAEKWKKIKKTAKNLEKTTIKQSKKKQYKDSILREIKDISSIKSASTNPPYMTTKTANKIEDISSLLEVENSNRIIAEAYNILIRKINNKVCETNLLPNEIGMLAAAQIKLAEAYGNLTEEIEDMKEDSQFDAIAEIESKTRQEESAKSIKEIPGSDSIN